MPALLPPRRRLMVAVEALRALPLLAMLGMVLTGRLSIAWTARRSCGGSCCGRCC